MTLSGYLCYNGPWIVAVDDRNYSKALATELAPKGIRVNSFAPGFTHTMASERLIERMTQERDVIKCLNIPLTAELSAPQ